MIYKIIRVIAVLLTAVATCLVIPMIFNMFFSSHGEHHDVVYSELLDDFIRSEYEYQNNNGRLTATSVYIDSKGNRYSSVEADSLCPLDNASQLAYDDKFPDTICGKHVTAKEAGDAKFQMNISGSRPSLFYGLSELKDRKSSVSAKYETSDLFRINKDGIEFIEAASNEVNKEKSTRFNAELGKFGFEAPAQVWWSPADRTEFERTGYMVVDNKGDLYNLAMEDGEPSVKRVELPDGKKVLSVNFSNQSDFLAIAIAEDGSSYVMDNGMKFKRLPIKSLKGKAASLKANLMFLTVIVYDDDKTSYYVMDRNYKLLKSTSSKIEKEKSIKEDVASYLFPMSIYQSASKGIRIVWNNPLHFIWLNIVLTILFIFIRRKKGHSVKDTYSVIDAIIILLFGIFGIAGVFAIPRRENY